MVGWSLRGQCTQLSQGALCRRSSASLWKKKVRVCVCVSRASILTLRVLEEHRELHPIFHEKPYGKNIKKGCIYMYN